jgi:AcrR family transcriptional regulator
MTDPIQEQLIKAREEQILSAAAIVFAEKGFHSTTIRDIAKRAGISDGTIYNYFDNKTSLLLGIFNRMRASILQEERTHIVVDVDQRTFIKMILTHPLKALEKDEFALFRIVFSEMLVNAELRKLYYEQILEPTLLLAEEYFQKQAANSNIQINPERVRLKVRAISGMVMGLVLENIMGDDTVKLHWDEMSDFLADLILPILESSK